ncbi:MAG: M1 family metallopeptidase [Gemmatimonadota bacterium]|jgi:hypothetical protein|nr:M1 family metallopeptidase [Gemmatimonadota bacterium]
MTNRFLPVAVAVLAIRISVAEAALAQVTPASGAEAPQGVEYRIEARLDETTDVLSGRAELRYTNNSVSPLDTLWLHQHLNAFRPESAWARRELEFGIRRYQDLGPDDHAFDRLQVVTADGAVLTPVYPLAPDSTVVGFPLPRTLPAGGTVTVRFDWQARLSTIPRRQGREGRHYDFAQWYPRIAVYDGNGWHTQELLPQGEFFGEFASYDVTLEVADDQVIGATGVPVDGDPGWARRARPGFDTIINTREFYGEPAEAPGLGLLTSRTPDGTKRVRWIARNVHHFAWTTSPDYIYEGGSVENTGGSGGNNPGNSPGNSRGGNIGDRNPIAIHVLYQPADSASWGGGVVTERTENALRWLQEIFGPYLWPQLTNVHRIEPGGTEFPMMVMNGSPSEGLIIHEGAHQYIHGMLANNEFDAGWLDEGFVSFLENWYWEEHPGQDAAMLWAQSMAGIRGLELAGVSEPIAQPGAAFRDPNVYSALTYTKTALIFRMLRWVIGEEAMREAMHTLYARSALQHFDEHDLREVFNGVSGQELGWFFDQWFHTTAQLDYRITSATTTPDSNGGWTTRVEVQRAGEAWMPVIVRVGEVEERLESRDRIQVVMIRTASRPDLAVLDPEGILIDLIPANNTLRVSGP